MSAPEIRGPADAGERLAWLRLGRLAFGGDPDAPLDPSVLDRPGDRLGVFTEGRLAAKLVVLPYAQWWGGRRVPMGGVAGVAVAPEERGRGHARALLGAALPRMRERGEVVSGLFPTAIGLYRGAGWELAGARASVRVDAARLGVAAAGGVTLQRVGPEDLPGLHAVYTAVGSSTNGMLTREGPCFADGQAGVLGLDGATVAVEAGEITGYLTYTRGRGYGGAARLQVHDLLATTRGATATLLGHLAGWGTVTPSIDLPLPPGDAVPLLLPGALPLPSEHDPFMLRIVDAAAAVRARGWPAGVAVEVDLELRDALAPWNAGRWRLSVAEGEGRLEPGGSGAVALDITGLATLYASYAGSAALCQAGLLDGPAAALARVDAAFAGPPPRLLDYF